MEETFVAICFITLVSERISSSGQKIECQNLQRGGPIKKA